MSPTSIPQMDINATTRLYGECGPVDRGGTSRTARSDDALRKRVAHRSVAEKSPVAKTPLMNFILLVRAFRGHGE